MKQAGLDQAIARRITFHCLRHTFASEFMGRGGDIYKLKQILGHSTVTQTEKYAHFAPDYVSGSTDFMAFEVMKPTLLAVDK